MTIPIIFSAIVIFGCILGHRFSARVGVPALLLFMALGMIFGSDGILKIPFDNYVLAEKICTVSLLFIIFYGGFCTKWKTAKPVVVKAGLLATIGVLLTAGLTSLFCYLVLNFSFIESFLAGAVISSTDAASVFSILVSKKLNLKYGTAPLLEIESGSNDPVSFMLVIVGLSLINGDANATDIVITIFTQIIFGALIGAFTAMIGGFVCKKNFIPDSMEDIFVIGLALFGFGMADYLNGNGYLSVYIMGIILGNLEIKNKISLVHFFNGVTGLAQIIIFFLLGLLAFPSRLPSVFFSAISIAIFLIFIARPISVFLVLKPFKATTKQCLLVSWAGLRGAASIVFAIFIISGGGSESIHYDIFHIVFMISLISVAVQGSLLPYVSKKLDMVDEKNDVRKTFNDYQEESSITLMKIFINKGHNWANKTISQISLPTNSLALMIKRDGKTIIPKGDTMIYENDNVILSVPSYSENNDEINLDEIKITKKHKWCGKYINELNLQDKTLIVMVKRGESTIIPNGSTTILKGDTVIVCH